MAETTRKRGRKAKPASQGARVSLGLKVTPEIKNRLDAEAKRNGRTQSQEAEVRLENSFRYRDALSEVLGLRYGEPIAALTILIGDIMDRGRSVASMTRAHEKWLDDQETFDWVVKIVNAELFERLRPTAAANTAPDGEPVLAPEAAQRWMNIQRQGLKSHIGSVINWIKAQESAAKTGEQR
jgi:hypothetical protein